ncbi:MAG: CAP domain-containing protein [Acidimicrobiales bacterium]
MSVLAPTNPADDDAPHDPWAAPPARFTGLAPKPSGASFRDRLQDLLDDPRNRIILTMAAVAVVGLMSAAALDALRSGAQPDGLTTLPSVVGRSAPGGDTTAGAVGFGAAEADEVIQGDGTTPTATSAPASTTANALTVATVSSTTSTASAPSTTATPTSAETEPPVTEPPSTTVESTVSTDEVPTTAAPTSEVPSTTPESTTPTSVSTTASTAPAPTAPLGGGSTQQQILDLANVERGAAGCGPLSLDTRLSAAAQAHSDDMGAQNYFSHTGLDGSQPGDRARAAGYSGSSIGENIAQGYRSPEAVMTGWMNSSGHRANILNCGHRHLGVGHSANGNYWTQLFGR